MRIGKYEIGRSLGQGNFAKVKLATDLRTRDSFAVKILHKDTLLRLNIAHRIKREISILKILKHPNIVRLNEVLASKSKIYMIFEYVKGGELLNKIGKLTEKRGRRVFHQLMDAVSYCHAKAVFHRDLKLENILVDAKGNIKVSDFGLSAAPQHVREDGLLHTACGSPNYVAPEILANKGYDGRAVDIWSCGVVLFIILTGFFPFDDTNLVVLYYKIAKGSVEMPEWLSPGAQDLLRRILEPNPAKRIQMVDIKAHPWFKQGYTPQDGDDGWNQEASEGERNEGLLPTPINAFQLISMASFFDLSGFFEQEDASERKVRFTSNLPHDVLLNRIEEIGTGMGFGLHMKNGKLKLAWEEQGCRGSGSLYVTAQVFEISWSLYVVEMTKSYGDGPLYRQLCRTVSSKLAGQDGVADSTTSVVT